MRLGGTDLLSRASRSPFNNASESFGYDAAEQMVHSSIRDAAVAAIDKDLQYDPAGNRTFLSFHTPEGSQELHFTYAYDELNRLKSQTDWRGQTYLYEYDELSRRTKLTRPNGVVTEYGYDDDSELTSLVHKASDGSVLLGIAYEYDAAGNRTAITYSGIHPFLNGRHEYTYDALNRLLTATHPVGSILPNEFYTYDAVGNRLTSHRSAHYNYDSANRLLSDDQFTYTYDAVGNLATRTSKNNSVLPLTIGTSESPLFAMDTFSVGTTSSRTEAPDSLMRRTVEQDLIAGNNHYTGRTWMYDNEDWVCSAPGSLVQVE